MADSLLKQIQSQMIAAMRAKDATTLEALRFLTSIIKNAQIDKHGQLTDQEITNIIRKQVKKQQEEISFLEKANRTQRAQQEKQKLEVLINFLPPGLDDDQVKSKILQAIPADQLKSQTIGQLMGRLVKVFQGQIPNDQLARVLKSLKNS
ncbi:MAG: GatB/YqeY domain-containing protein [bacterium]|nr:GatB/YqeY domain-containing protein [bacterium]